MNTRADALLDGPRGRRACLEVLSAEASGEFHQALFWASYWASDERGTLFGFSADGTPITPEAEPAPSAAELAAIASRIDLSGPVDAAGALAASVGSAMYWEARDGDDAIAAEPELRPALRRAAERLVEDPATAWWWREATAEQWAIEADDRDAPDPIDVGAALDQWRSASHASEEEAIRDRASDPHANLSGAWWSTPDGIPVTTGPAPTGEPVGLRFVEDAFSWAELTASAVEWRGRVFEIRSSRDWAALCRRYPLAVTASRRHDWYRVTGRSGGWLIPDWSRVRADWDGVHLSVGAYLEAATREIPVDDDGATVLAGWSPDETRWLSNVAHRTGERVLWREQDDESWRAT
ncbi:hypothetical protein [Microbacterium indicum]|uniref:hypothetical protein n=1 Tax=Microbacterium indicum TaxID=358100 RepID=UPI00040992C2|nr:hypothetical protein [Microbacterium indicum]